MKILALDLGTTTGWAYLDNQGVESGHWTSKTYAPWGAQLIEVLSLYKPDIIVCSQTNSFGHFNATKKMYMLYGVVCLLAERCEYPVVEFNDSSARKAVFGSGKLKKVEAHAKLNELHPEFKEFTGDQKDAIVLGLGWQMLNHSAYFGHYEPS
jgi:Holliday junction resolvasome RuvABC endonuclease subunit